MSDVDYAGERDELPADEIGARIIPVRAPSHNHLCMSVETEHCAFDNRDSTADKIAELIEDLRHRLTLNDCNIGERYRHGDLHILVNWRSGITDFEAVFGAAPNFTGWDRAIARRETDTAERGTNGDQFGVFIDQIQVMQDSEQVAVPSVVWFQRGNSSTDGFGNFLAFCPQRDFEPRFVWAMREIRFLRRLTRQYGASTDGLVERGAQIVEGICGSQAQYAGHWLRKPNYHYQIPRFRVHLGVRSYNVRFKKRFGSGTIITDVMFGPFNL
jgi:hypothetical protein